MLKNNFGPGDKLVQTNLDNKDVIAQAFMTPKGKKILLINTRKKETMMKLPLGIKDETAIVVDVNNSEGLKQILVTDNTIILKPFAVGVITLPD